MIKTRILPALVAAALAAPGAALAAGGGGEVEDISFSFEGPFGTFDAHQLQRGFQVFHTICASCHGMKFVAFRELGRADGPHFPKAQVKAIAAQYTCIDPQHEDGERPCKDSDLFPKGGNAAAPDLSLMAKARAGFHGPYGTGLNQLFKGMGGAEYIYSLMSGYRDAPACAPDDFAGAYNVAFAAGGFPDECKDADGKHTVPGSWIAMDAPIYDGVADDYDINYGPYDATGALIASEGAESGGGHAYHAPEATVEQMSEDVAAFLMFVAEPTMTERKSAGFRNVVMLIFLTVLLYYTNKKLWAPIKRKD